MVKWFRPQQPHVHYARLIREDYAAGRFSVAVPSLLFVEVLNAAARRWSWNAEALSRLANDLGGLEFDVAEPEIAAVANWTSHGLTAYDSVYVALAEGRGARLVTDDEHVISLAGSIALPLNSYTRTGDAPMADSPGDGGA